VTVLTVTAVLMLSASSVGASPIGAKRPPPKRPAASAPCRQAFKHDVAKRTAGQTFANLPTTLTSCTSASDWSRAAQAAGVLNAPQYLSAATVLLSECATATQQGGVCRSFGAYLTAPLRTTPHASGAALPCGEWWTAVSQFRAGQAQQGLSTAYAAANNVISNFEAQPTQLVTAANNFETATATEWPATIEQFSETCVEFASPPSRSG